MLRRLLLPMLLTGAATCFVATPVLAAPVSLTILHTNDTHDHLEPFETRRGPDQAGVARRATLFQRVRAAEKNVLVLDGGDVFQGTPLFTFFSGEPDYMTMQQAGYDAVTVGNHDMDNGLANLLKQAKHLSQPPLSLTLVDTSGKLIFPSHRIVEKGGLKIALIGIMGKNAYNAIAETRRVGVNVLDPEAELKKLIPTLRKQVDLVIVLSHTGHEEEIALAKAVPGIDVIIGGHSHTKVDHPVVVKHADRETLVVQAFQWGEYVGRMDLVVDGHKIVKHTGELIPVTTDIKPDSLVEATVAKYAERINTQMKQVLGRSSFEFVNSRKAEGDAPIGNLIADALREESHADIALMNSGGIRSGIPKGEVTRGMVYSMLPFDNKLVTFTTTGQMVQEILDFAASRSGKSGSLQVSGLSFTVDNGHATGVLVAGKTLDPKGRYTLSTIDYLAAGNDGADVFRKAGTYANSGLLIRDVFMNYLKRHPVLENPPAGRIRKPS